MFDLAAVHAATSTIPTSDFGSGKKKRPTHKAQVVADKKTGKIVVTAFCEGKKNDFAFFKKSQTRIALRTLCLADSGYQGLDKQHPNSHTQKEVQVAFLNARGESRQPGDFARTHRV
jgi:hypothetical protein